MRKEDYHYPQIKKGDQLFIKSLDPWHNAIINKQNVNLIIYSSGYKRAADLLIEHIIQTRREQDNLIFPILFSYRQSIELNLKMLIRLGNALIDIFEDYPKHHDINKLWKKYRKIYCKIFSEEDILDDEKMHLESMDNLINQFSEVDPFSIDSRYPENKEGKRSLSILKYVDLKNLKRIMDGLDLEFAGHYAHLDEILGSQPGF